MRALTVAFCACLTVLVAYLALPQTSWIPRSSGLTCLSDMGDNGATFDTIPDSFAESLWGDRESTRRMFERVKELADTSRTLNVAELAILSRNALCDSCWPVWPGKNQFQEGRTEQSRVVAATVLKIDAARKGRDNDNAFWHLQRAVALLALDERAAARESVYAAARCTAYSKRGRRQTDQRTTKLAKQGARRTSSGSLQLVRSSYRTTPG